MRKIHLRVKGYRFAGDTYARVDKKLKGALDTFETNMLTLTDPIDAYLAHVNGSAFIRLPLTPLDGSCHARVLAAMEAAGV